MPPEATLETEYKKKFGKDGSKRSLKPVPEIDEPKVPSKPIIEKTKRVIEKKPFKPVIGKELPPRRPRRRAYLLFWIAIIAIIAIVITVVVVVVIKK